MISAVVSALLLLPPAPSAPAERPLTIPVAPGVRLSATLTVPPGPGPHPAAVLVGGFGPANRDGVFGDRPGGVYREMALGLARRGVAVLRYDKRGIGDSTGPALSWLDARPLAADAAAATRALAALPEDPLPDAGRAGQPALLVQGTADHTVPPSDVGRLARARRAAGRPTTVLRVPRAGHFLQVEGRVPLGALDAIAAFAR